MKNVLRIRSPIRAIALVWVAIFACLSLLGAETDMPRRLSVGADHEYRPLSYMKDGLPTGFDLEFIDRMGALLRVPVSFKLDNWSETLRSLSNNRIDLVSGVIQTESREGVFDFTIPYLTDQYSIYASRDSGIVSAGDLSGKRIALLDNDAVLETWVRPAGLDTEILTVSSIAEAFASVNSGVADYTVAPYSIGQTSLESGLYPSVQASERTLFPVEYRFAVKKGNTALVSFLNEGIAKMQREGETERLVQKWKIPNPNAHFLSIKSTGLYLAIILSSALAFLIGLLWYAIDYLSFRKRLATYQSDQRFLELVLENIPFGLRWESLDRVRQGENQLYRLFSGAQRRKAVRKKLVEINTAMSEPVGNMIVLEDASVQKELESRIKRLTREITEKNAQLVEQSIVEPVSGLLNRAFIKSKIVGLLEESRKHGEIFSVILIKRHQEDVDPFSVRAFARRLKSCIGVRDFAGSVGDGRFVIVMPGTALSDLAGVAARIESVLVEEGAETEHGVEFSLFGSEDQGCLAELMAIIQ